MDRRYLHRCQWSPSMTLVYYDPLFLEHRTGSHPEHPRRLEAVLARLHATGAMAAAERPPWQSATADQVARVHDRAYLGQLQAAIVAGGGRIEVDTVCSPRSLAAALLAAGAVCDAVGRVLAGPVRRALCLVRPPGHHALRGGAMGFCLLGNVAIGARAALAEHDLQRVLIVDWDVHHGNGTQDAFWEDGRVGFLSIHRWPFYPGSGAASETGAGAGLGTTLNLPIELGTGRGEYRRQFRRGLEALAARLRPELVLVSAGFDAHRVDPIGSLGLEVEDFVQMTRDVIDVANAHCHGRIVSVLEGGYDPTALAECVVAHLAELAEGPPRAAATP